ncbi:MAG: hypothetical protein IKI62_05250 [Clostridia bacterium]|nr:hypothetical protein [Clostridia bacterium]
MKKDRSSLIVKTMGELSISYDGNILVDKSQGKTQFSLLLQTIIHHRKTGASKNLLVQTLFEDRDIEDVSHSIRNIVYSARKKLKALGLPGEEFIIKKDNVYYWSDEVPVVEDASEFERAYLDALEERDMKNRFNALLAAAHKYTGIFLPGMEVVPWISHEQLRLKELFKSCMNDIESNGIKLEQYHNIYDISVYASNVDRFSEWEVMTVKSLVQLGRYSELEAFYNRTVDKYINEFGNRATEYVREVIKNLSMHMVYQHDNIDHIQTRLKDQVTNERGGYYCSFPVFQELYRTIERVMARSGDNIFLMLCTIVDSKGNPMIEGKKLDELSDRLSKAIIKSVRHSDTVTKYGKGQYLLLLFDTNKENCSIIQRRIDSNFLIGRQRTGVEYSVNKVILKDLDSISKHIPGGKPAK